MEKLTYCAFLSYSHADASVVAGLHRRLESFRTPRSLRTAAPSRLYPVFKDSDELSTAPRLSEAIESALRESAALIVVCSPAAVASRWVNVEIAYFRRHCAGRPIFLFVVAGDPGADPRQQPERAAIPLSLALEDPEVPDGTLAEPLAADARAEGDGFHIAFLKLAAGLLGVRFDELRRREQRRSQLRMAWFGTLSLALALLFAVLAWQAMQARDLARTAQTAAELELTSERQTRGFLLSVFQLANAREARGHSVTVREVLDQAVAKIANTPFSRAAVRSRFQATMGQAYSSLGVNQQAVALLRQSLASLEGNDPEDQLQRVESLIELADVLFDMGDYAGATQSLDQLDQLDALAGLSATQRARAANIRGDVLNYTEHDSEARAAYDRAGAGIEGAKTNETLASIKARSLFGIATLDMYAGEYAKADRGFMEAQLLLTAVFGKLHPETLTTIISRGANAYDARRPEEARTLWEESLQLALRMYDPDNPQVATIQNNLGRLLLETGELEAAAPLFRSTVESDRRNRMAEFDDLAFSLTNLGIIQNRLGFAAEARKLLEEGLMVAESSEHRMLGAAMNELADIHCINGDLSIGQELAARASKFEHARDQNDWRSVQADLTVAYCAGSTPRAETASLSKRLEGIAKDMPSKSPFLLRMRAQLKEIGSRIR